MRSVVTAEIIKKAALTRPYRYKDENDKVFFGLPVSQVSYMLRQNGWKNVPRLDAYDLKKLGMSVVTARYVGGVRPKRFCDVVFIDDLYTPEKTKDVETA